MTAVEERIDVEEAEDTRERVTVWDTREVLYVHPVASLFPMMAPDELEDLAADIRTNGLAEPIVLDHQRQLIDGRNRLSACAIAEVSPDFVVTPIEDAVAYILSKNIERRHLTKGQRAMIAYQATCSGSEQPERAAMAHLAIDLRMARSHVANAHLIATYAPDKVEGVISGTTPIEEAMRVARDRKVAAESTQAQMERLRLQASDLADLVVEDRMTLAEALAALHERHEEARRERHAVTQNLLRAIEGLAPGPWTADERAAHIAAHLEPERAGAEAISLTGLRACMAVLEALIRHLEKGE